MEYTRIAPTFKSIKRVGVVFNFLFKSSASKASPDLFEDLLKCLAIDLHRHISVSRHRPNHIPIWHYHIVRFRSKGAKSSVLFYHSEKLSLAC